MVLKSYFVILAGVIYIVSAYFLWWREKTQIKSSSFDKCSVGEACLQFCCKNETLCDENFIEKNFKTSQDAPIKVQAVFTKPECIISTLQTSPKSFKFEGNWTILEVSHKNLNQIHLFHHNC
jgi:hypothetical protein